MKPITTFWYRLEFLDHDGEWRDAGDVYEEQSKKYCRKEMVEVNFIGKKVRMVKFINQYSRVGTVGEIKDFT